MTSDTNEFIIKKAGGNELVRKVSDGTTAGYMYITQNGTIYKPTSYEGTGSILAKIEQVKD